jgi:hypothetical protein
LTGLVAALQAQTDPQIDATIGTEVTGSDRFSARELITSKMHSPLFDLDAALSVNSDGRYGADIAYFRNSGSFFNNYFLIEEGYTTVRMAPLKFQLGRIPHKEIYDSPYSLFLNSQGVNSNGMVLRYESPRFVYESRWIELNQGSDFGDASHTPEAWRNTGRTGFPDRGANLKTFLFQVGTMRLGLQEAGVYTGRSFDAEYFLDPVPEYFIQYLKGTGGRPWTTSTNENYLMGVFWDWREPGFSLGAQFLDDDFSFNFLSNSLFPNNPWKAAWTVGGTVESEWGRWGFYHAGALKYTFEPITTGPGGEAQSAYGYTLYPDVEYWTAGGFRSLEISDNALGYLQGENNLALMATWSREWNSRLSSSAALEYLLAGANSPANPWQDGTGGNQSELGTHWLDDPVLSQSVVAEGRAVYGWGDWVLTARLKLGVEFHALELRSPLVTGANLSSLDQSVKIYAPSDHTRAIWALALGATWHWDLGAMLDGMQKATQ